MTATIKIAESLGYNLRAMGELLPACETGMVKAINAKLGEGGHDRD